MIKKNHVVSQGREKNLEQAISEYLEWMIVTGYAESGLKAYLPNVITSVTQV